MLLRGDLRTSTILARTFLLIGGWGRWWLAAWVGGQTDRRTNGRVGTLPFLSVHSRCAPRKDQSTRNVNHDRALFAASGCIS